MLCHLIYVSRESQPMRDRDLTKLLMEARKRNERARVTGMLLYKDKRFIQILEGHEENVLEVFGSIKCDVRHEQVKLIWMQYVQYRDFPDWTMGFVNRDEVDVQALPGFTPFLKRDLRYENYCQDSTDVHAMLNAFKECPESLQ